MTRRMRDGRGNGFDPTGPGDMPWELVSGDSATVNTSHFLTPYPDVCLQDLNFDFSNVA